MNKTEFKEKCVSWFDTSFPASKGLVIESNLFDLILINPEGKAIPFEVVLKGQYHEKTEIKRVYDLMFKVVKSSSRDAYFLNDFEQFKTVANYEMGKDIDLEKINEIRHFKQHLNIIANQDKETKSFKL